MRKFWHRIAPNIFHFDCLHSLAIPQDFDDTAAGITIELVRKYRAALLMLSEKLRRIHRAMKIRPSHI